MYYHALDTALMEFHATKIEEINTKIRELWNLVYKGRDIDRVELKADKNITKAGNTSYDYRVVMRKVRTCCVVLFVKAFDASMKKTEHD